MGIPIPGNTILHQTIPHYCKNIPPWQPANFIPDVFCALIFNVLHKKNKQWVLDGGLTNVLQTSVMKKHPIRC